MDGNTHQKRVFDIQRLVRYISMSYDNDIHKRLLELGVDDFVWDEKQESPTFFRLRNPPQKVESHCTVTIDL